MKQQRYSQKRQMIIESLGARKDHPTAEQLYEQLKDKGVSLPTVYRNLAQLSESGEILRLKTGGGVDRFDADTSSHTHFECTKCGAVADVLPAVSLNIAETAPEGLEISGYNLVFYGVCERCQHADN